LLRNREAYIVADYLENAREYWDNRYSAEGEIWGRQPSATAYHALKIFRKAGLKTLLVPGSGYGRHTAFFSGSGFKVTGTEVSPVAISLARRFDPVSTFYNASALDMSFDHQKYDSIYCFNVLHLLRENDRGILIRACAARLAAGGLMYFTVFSEKESEYGQGKEVEKNTFETRPGRPAHYFTEEDLREHFAGYNVGDTGLIKDPEDHGGKPHTHILRYIYASLKV
jgi:2-polyprenyl-3-methyl-5-hydroxy-6-metoxy-1,4-benzoquinol methylase